MEKVLYNLVYNYIKIRLYTFYCIYHYCVKIIILKIDTVYVYTHIHI